MGVSVVVLRSAWICELKGVLFVAQLEVDVCILGSQRIQEPSHHVGDLSLADIIRLAPHAPGEGEVTKGGELSQDINHKRQIPYALPDREGERESLKVRQHRQLSYLIWPQTSIPQHCLRLDLQLS